MDWRLHIVITVTQPEQSFEPRSAFLWARNRCRSLLQQVKRTGPKSAFQQVRDELEAAVSVCIIHFTCTQKRVGEKVRGVCPTITILFKRRNTAYLAEMSRFAKDLKAPYDEAAA